MDRTLRALLYVTPFFLIGWLPVSASVVLPLDYHHQERELSCEAAALKMVLNFHQIKISEAEIIKKMPIDPTKKLGGVWGDPDVGFVGDIDGKMGETGYGIHWNAFARWASKWKKSIILGNKSITGLISHLDAKRPVIIWTIMGPRREMTWKTAKGRKVFALENEHTQVVYGYEGPKEAPTTFHIMDPEKGPQTRSTADFLKDWDTFGRKAVVVYP
jgi:uncharacterized protein YvpB